MPEQNYTPEQLKDMLKSMDLTSKRAQFFRNQINQAGRDMDQLNQVFQSLTAEQERLSDAFAYANETYASLRDIGQAMLKEQGQRVRTERDANNALQKTVNIAKELNTQHEGFVALSESELKNRQKRLRFQQQDQKFAAETILRNNSILKTNESLTDLTQDRLAAAASLSEEERSIVEAALQGNTLESSLIEKIERELTLRKEVRRTLGATGVIMDGLAGIADKLGMKGLSDDIKDIKEDIQDNILKNVSDLNAKLTKAGRESATFSEKMGLAAKNVGAALKGIGQMGAMIVGQLLNPINLVVASLAKVTDAFFSLDAAEVDFSRLTGRAAKNFATMNNSLVLGKDVLETMTELTNDLSRDSMAIFDPQDVARIAETSKFLGLSAREAGNMAKMTNLSGLTIEQFEKQIEAGHKEMVNTTGAAVSLGTSMKAVYSVSDELANVLDNNPKTIAAAATAAASLGLSLERVDQIASGLLDFEQSINAELEAQLLTGRAMNLSKARELALNNDLAGLAVEIGKNADIQAAFASNNRVQQEAVAKALGMSRSELAKSYALRKLDEGVSAEQLANVTGMTAQQLKQLSVQDKLNLVTGKLAEAFAPLLDILHPVADVLLFISKTISFGVSNTIGLVTQSERFKATMTSVKDTVGIIGEKISSFFGDEETSPLTKILGGLGGLATGAGLVLGGKKLLGMVTRKIGLGGGRGIKDAKVDSDGSLFVKIRGMASSVGDILSGRKGKGGILKSLKDTILKSKGGQKAAGIGSKLSNVFKGLGKSGIGKVAGKAGRLAGKVAAPLTSLAMTGKGMFDFFGDKKLRGTGVGGFLESMGGTGAKILETLSFGASKYLTNMTGLSIKGFDTDDLAGARAIYRKLVPDAPTAIPNKTLIEHIQDNPDSYPEGITEQAMQLDATELAVGGIATSRTNAVVGEAGAEAVIPLTEFYKKMEEQTTAIVEAVLTNKDVYFDTAKVTAATAMNNYRR